MTGPAGGRVVRYREIRPVADLLNGGAGRTCDIGTIYVTQGVAAKLAGAADDDVIVDGPRVDDGAGNMVPKDGRSVVTVGDVKLLMEFLGKFGALLAQATDSNPARTYQSVVDKLFVNPHV